MRILFINDFGSHGGAENYIAGVMSELEPNHEVELLTLAGENSEINFEEKGVLSYVEKLFSPFKRRKIRGKIEEFDPDVIHVHNIHKGTMPTLRALKDLEKPVIKTFHDYGYFCICPYAMHGDKLCEGAPERCWSDGEVGLKQYLFRKVLHGLRLKHLRVFDQILVPSEDLKSVVENFASAQVIPNFVDTEEFHPAEDVDREGILFVGRVTEEKGIEVLIEALSETNLSGKVVGKGEVEKYRELSKRKNADLDFKGYVDETELVEMYRESEVTAVPSVWRESFNLVGLESLACGTPVVASDQGGMQDYVEKGENGCLFERGNPGDLLSQIQNVRDKELATNRFLIEDVFKQENHVSRLESIYEGM